jgi:hypothetical protein
VAAVDARKKYMARPNFAFSLCSRLPPIMQYLTPHLFWLASKQSPLKQAILNENSLNSLTALGCNHIS